MPNKPPPSTLYDQVYNDIIGINTSLTVLRSDLSSFKTTLEQVSRIVSGDGDHSKSVIVSMALVGQRLEYIERDITTVKSRIDKAGYQRTLLWTSLITGFLSIVGQIILALAHRQ